MTDRVISLVVALEKEFRIDDIKEIISAIEMIKNVNCVTPNIYTCSDQMNAWAAEKSFKLEFLNKIIDAIKEK